MKKLLIRIIFLISSLQAFDAVAAEYAIFADAIVLHASQQESSCWATVISLPSSRTLDLNSANVNFDWNLGFRGGAIYEAENRSLESRLYWTYFLTTTSSSLNAGEQIITSEFFSGFLSNNFFFSANINWRIAMNMIDYDIGYKFHLAKNLMIRPSIGIKAGTINQSIACAWNAATYIASESLKNNYTGVGPTIGIDTRWNVYKNLSFIGDFAAAFMWGNWVVNDVYSRPNADLGLVTATTISTSMNRSFLGTMMFRYCLGLEWIYQGRSNLSFQLGYEMQYWANQLRLTTFQQLPLHGDLTLQGGTCRIRIEL